MFCCQCAKKATAKRTIDNTTKICSVCSSATVTDPTVSVRDRVASDAANTSVTADGAEQVDIDDNTMMSSVSFGMFKTWISSKIRSIIQEEMTKVNEHFAKLDKDVKTLQSDMKSAKTNITTLQSDVKTAKSDIANLTKRSDDHKSISENNLKYLINHDRNERRKNVLLFGVPEGKPTGVDGVPDNLETDIEKCLSLFELIQAPQSMDKVIDCFRIGPIVDDKVCPIKVKFFSPISVTTILKNSRKLSESSNRRIYIKPDKSKSESAEFQRLGKRKAELLEQYPTENNAEPRVTLMKGVLKLDGTEVDRYKPVQSLF